MVTVVTVLHICACIFLIPLILVQSGRGGDVSSSFGGGSSQTIFGSSGGANFFTRATSFIAGAFMITSLGLTWLANRNKASVFDGYKSASAPVSAPATPGGAPADAAASKEAAPAQPTAPVKAAAPAKKPVTKKSK